MGEFHGRRVTLMGLGRFGGGLGVARWLASQGADLVITDLDSPENLAGSVAGLGDLAASPRVSIRFGGHDERDFAAAELVVANPAVPRPWENRFLGAARAAGVPITTEIGLLVERLPDRGRVIGITGTSGKSTTSAMVAHILEGAGRRHVLGGNFGGSLLPRLAEITAEHWVVLELSSAMLHWLDGWSPGIAGVTGFAPNHLDWHETIEHYAASKRRILASQRPGDGACLGPTLGEKGWRPARGVRSIQTDGSGGFAALAVPGLHNLENAHMAVGICAALGDEAIEPELGRRLVASFAGLPHRLEVVGEFGGVRFINDSKATTPEAASLAIESVAERHVRTGIHLIAGGYDKGIDLAPWAKGLGGLAGVYTIGATGAAIAASVRAVGGLAEACGTMDRAVERAWERARPGDAILLSPACASWDQFVNFEARGERFRRLAQELARGRAGVNDLA